MVSLPKIIRADARKSGQMPPVVSAPARTAISAGLAEATATSAIGTIGIVRISEYTRPTMIAPNSMNPIVPCFAVATMVATAAMIHMVTTSARNIRGCRKARVFPLRPVTAVSPIVLEHHCAGDQQRGSHRAFGRTHPAHAKTHQHESCGEATDGQTKRSHPFDHRWSSFPWNFLPLLYHFQTFYGQHVPRAGSEPTSDQIL